MRALFRLYGSVPFIIRIMAVCVVIGYGYWTSDMRPMNLVALFLAFEAGSDSDTWIGWAYMLLAFAALLSIAWFV